MVAKNQPTKAQLRSQLLASRTELNKRRDYKKSLSTRIHEQLIALQLWQTPQIVHTYLPKKHEVDTWPVIEWLWQANHKVWGSYLPKDPMSDGFVRLTPRTQYESDRYKAPLPLGEVRPNCNPTAVLVPAIAVDQSGCRLGYGGGWYDQFLSKHPAAVRICLIDDNFAVAQLPHEPHDQQLDLIVTNTKIIHTRLR